MIAQNRPAQRYVAKLQKIAVQTKHITNDAIIDPTPWPGWPFAARIAPHMKPISGRRNAVAHAATIRNSSGLLAGTGRATMRRTEPL
jgi:hypothetical protein